MKIIANYAFLPWLRVGVANTIASGDGDASVKTRAAIDVGLKLSGDPIGGGAELTQSIAQKIALYGPGDIVGIDPRQIVRTEPRAANTNFEANYLPAVDFYDEDFPWRYTPAAPGGGGLQLRPWLALIVLTDTEFQDGGDRSGRPLPYISLNDTTVFPPASDLWAWAHVHVNASLATTPGQLVSPDMSAVLPLLQSIVAQNRDAAYSRLVCPRRLADNTRYTAFVVPTFETGRLAGLGKLPDAAPFATFSAWASYGGQAEALNFPVYYRWSFTTASHGDFEYLVSILKPQPVDKRVGTRDMDVQQPGSNIPGITDAALAGILRLGGALQVPLADLGPADLAERQKYDGWAQPYPRPFQIALAKFVNLPDDYATQSAASANTASGIDDDPDPLITAPLYGRWHALTQRLLFNRDGSDAPNTANWVHDLNLDPRFRVAANFGTDVVQTNAETYMNAAWEQIGAVLAANAHIRRLKFAQEVSWRWHERHVKTLAATNVERALGVTAPVASRVITSGATVAFRRAQSFVPSVYTTTAMRRVVRPRSRLMRSLPFTPAVTPHNLLARVNDGSVTAAPPKAVPTGVPTLDQAAAAAGPKGVPIWLLDLLHTYPWLPYAELAVALAIALVLLVIPVLGILAAVVVAVAGILLFRLLRKWQGFPEAGVLEANQTAAEVDGFPKNPTFVLSDPGSTLRPMPGGSDSATALRFKAALRDSFGLIVATNAVSTPRTFVKLDLPALTTVMVRAIDPQTTIAKRGLTMISIPPWIRELIGDDFGEVMAYPKIDLPMYVPLKGISAELFLPNLNLIPENSITLIETNQKFIESYMVGLNHEFARKLLWREYPTDQRGSYFRQFWDASSYLNSDGLTQDQLYDIPELHRWPLDSALGTHNNRASSAEKGEEAVLVIRGELLKRYPTAVIYAHHAQWARNADGSINLTQARTLEDIDDAFVDKPPRTVVRTPLYEAKVDPDIYFFGFDLTVPEAKGGSGQVSTDDPGWFFVIKQRPGEPRFGLELTRPPSLEVFEELTWEDAHPGAAAGTFLAASDLSAVALAAPPLGDPENKGPQQSDDKQVAAAAQSAARWAYLLFREPVMVAVHADQLLRSTP